MSYLKIVEVNYFFPSYSPGMLPFGSLLTTCYSKATLISDLLEEDGVLKL